MLQETQGSLNNQLFLLVNDLPQSAVSFEIDGPTHESRLVPQFSSSGLKAAPAGLHARFLTSFHSDLG